MKVGVLVPISPFESLDVVLESLECIKSLDFGEYEFKIVYVVDKNLECAEELKKKGVEVLYREEARGRRAGAINDAIKFFSDFNPKYVAIFDVDSRPERNFILECIKVLERDEKIFIASSRRYINNGINLPSETVEAEYHLINFFLNKLSWKQFNGLIGVLRYEYLKRGLEESAITEDAEFSTRMYAEGLRAEMVETTKLYEEAPMSWKELYLQRKRWYFGGLQLWKHRKKLKGKVKFSWIMALTLSYIVIVALPLLLLSPPLILYHYKKFSKLKVVFGLLIHTLLLQLAALDAFLSYIFRKDVNWGKMRRKAEFLNTKVKKI